MISPNKVFFSVYDSSLSSEKNHANHVVACELLAKAKIKYSVVKGVNKGVPELTIMLLTTDMKEHLTNIDSALDIVAQFQQDSIIEVANDGRAMLMSVAGEGSFIGKLTLISETAAINSDQYIFEPLTKTYYGII